VTPANPPRAGSSSSAGPSRETPPRSRVAAKRLVPRLALTPAEAAESIGCSRSFFDEVVKRELRLVRVGAKVLVPVSEIEKWLQRSAARTIT
jgi:excisionase family DNA binding protein